MRALPAVLRPSTLDRDEVLVLPADHDGGVVIGSGEGFLVFFADEAAAGGAIERVQGGVNVGAGGGGEFGTRVGEADPAAGPLCELGVRVADEVLRGRCGL